MVADPLTIANAALKVLYLPLVREQLSNKNVLLAQVESNSDDVQGVNWEMSLHLGRNQGLGSRAELGTLPDAGHRPSAKATGTLVYHYGLFQVSGPVIRASRTDEGSFVRAVSSEQKDILESLRFDQERQCWGTSDGVIVATAVTSASTTVNLGGTAVQRRQLVKGMIIDIGTVASPTSVASGRTITAVGTSTIIISGAAVTTATTDRIFRSGNGGAEGGVGRKERNGVQALVAASGSVHGLSTATEAAWASYVDSTAAAISDARIEQALDEISISRGDTASVIGFGSHRVLRAYSATLTTLKQFTNTIDLKGGFKGLMVGSGGSGEVALTAVRDAPENSIYFIDTMHLKEHKSSDWEWVDFGGGSVLNPKAGSAGTDAYEGVLYIYADLAVDSRNAHAAILNIS